MAKNLLRLAQSKTYTRVHIRMHDETANDPANIRPGVRSLKSAEELII